MGPQRWKLRVPVKLPPVTASAAESVAVTEPPPIERLDADGVVTSDDVQWPRAPPAKSNSVAVSDCEERVSPRNDWKHSLERFSAVRSTPPSKNSEAWRVVPTPSVL